MSFEKLNMESNQQPVEEGEKNALMPNEMIGQLKSEIKESHNRLRKLSADFNILSEEDYFETKEKLEGVLNKINDVKVEQQILSDKLNEVLHLQEDFTKESLEKELDGNAALKN